MSELRERIEKRTQDLRILLSGLERKRDEILDQLASKKGESVIIEEIIRTVYTQIKQASEEETRIYQEEQQKEQFKKASKGVKTPKKKATRENVTKN